MDGLFVRSLGVFTIFLLLYLPTGRIKNVLDIPTKNIILFLMGGILSGFLGMYFYFHVLQSNPSSKVVPLASTYPLIAVIISMLFLKESVTWQRIVGTVLIIAGVLLVK